MNLKGKRDQVLAYSNYLKDRIATIEKVGTIDYEAQILAYEESRFNCSTDLAQLYGRLSILMLALKAYQTLRFSVYLKRLFKLSNVQNTEQILIAAAVQRYENKNSSKFILGQIQSLNWLLNGCLFKHGIEVLFDISYANFKQFYHPSKILGKCYKFRI